MGAHLSYCEGHHLLISNASPIHSAFYIFLEACFKYEIEHHGIGIVVGHFHQLLMKIQKQHFMHWMTMVTSRFVFVPDLLLL